MEARFAVVGRWIEVGVVALYQHCPSLAWLFVHASYFAQVEMDGLLYLIGDMQYVVAVPGGHFDDHRLNDAQAAAQRHSDLVYIVWQRRCEKVVVVEQVILEDFLLPIWDYWVG